MKDKIKDFSLYLGYYGKLPQFGDFIRSEGDTVSSEKYQQWLDVSFSRIMSAFGDNSSAGFDSLTPLHMVIKLPEAPTAVAAVCIPSRDKAGRRSPFTIYTEIPLEDFDNNLAHLPATYNMFFNIANKCIQEAESCFRFDCQQDTLWTLQQGLRVDLAETKSRFASYTAGTTVGQFIESYGDQFNENSKLVENTVFALYSAKVSNSNQFHALFRFPLSEDSEKSALESAFWIHLAEAVMHKPLGCQAIMWQKSRLDLIFDVPHERMLPLGWVDDLEDDNIWEFKLMDFGSAPPEEVPADKIDNLADLEDVPMAELISKAGTA
ncbi:MAG: type VI secretion system-associated protein TagF [bacterium]|nr:type VI secretion system-associated protein TagF [bacterium]